MDNFTTIVDTDFGKQVHFGDSRYYQSKNGGWFPGISEILNVVSKGKQYETWLKSNGFNADILAHKAMGQGSKVHDAIQILNMGGEINFTDGYTRDEWIMINKYLDFFIEFKPQIIEVEKVLVSDELGFGSQIDLVCMLQGHVWLIDHKTGSLYDSANIQVSAYKKLWDQFFPKKKIERLGVLHLDSTHRGADKTGKSIQGRGWKLVEVDGWENNYEDFKHIQAIWLRKNPNYAPFLLTYPATIKL